MGRLDLHFKNLQVLKNLQLYLHVRYETLMIMFFTICDTHICTLQLPPDILHSTVCNAYLHTIMIQHDCFQSYIPYFTCTGSP